MATEAQVVANRSNAQKSTGPRTPEGKAVVSQNAVKHGLLAREGVVRGEDWEEWERHREMLLEELRPAGALEVILAARIVDLTWRLYRAAQDQNETFGALYDRHTADAPEPAEPAERGATLGRMLLEDFGRDAVLERLLRQERRIEGSLYRTLNELRRVHDQGRKADLEAANTLERWREEDDQARKALAFAFCRPADSPSRPDGGTTGTARFEVPHPCDVPSWPYSSPAADAPARDKTCETNPICPEPEESQVRCGTAVMSDSPPNGLRQTNPISAGAGEERVPCGIEAKEVGRGRPTYEEPPAGVGTNAVEARGQVRQTNPICDLPRPEAAVGSARGAHGRDGRATHGRDGEPKRDLSRLGTHTHATAPPDSVGTDAAEVPRQLCETSPIHTGPREPQILCAREVMDDSAPNGRGKTKPICDLAKTEADAEDAWDTHGRDGHATHGRDGDPKRDPSRLGIHTHATGTPEGVTTNRLEAEERLCETNQIPGGHNVDRPAACDARPSRGAGTDSAKQSQFVANCLPDHGLRAGGTLGTAIS